MNIFEAFRYLYMKLKPLEFLFAICVLAPLLIICTIITWVKRAK